MVVAFTRMLGLSSYGPEYLENQLTSKQKLAPLEIKLWSLDYRQYAKYSKEKEDYCQQVNIF